MILDCDVECGQVVVKEICGYFVEIDVMDEVFVKVVMGFVVKNMGIIMVVVNCVGIVLVVKILGCDGLYDLVMFQKVIDINLVGSFNVVCLVSVVMVKNVLELDGVCGVIINMVFVVVMEG